MPIQGGLDVSGFVGLLLVAFLVALAGQRHKLPYPLALVCTGLAIGATGAFPEVRLAPQTLFTLFLPPLLFESALHIRAQELRNNARVVFLLAVLGTVLSAFVIAALISWVFHVPLLVTLVFGALISPTDPISVIAMLKRQGVDRRLYLILEAESLFNDGVAVVLFTSLLTLAAGQSIGLWTGVVSFLVMMLGGTTLGGLIGWMASRIARRSDDHLLDLMLTTIVAFGSYLLAEAVHVSGVVAVVSAGLVVGNHGMAAGMTARSRLAVTSFWEYAAFLVNSIVFLLIGIEADAAHWWEHPAVLLVGIPIVLVGRAIAVYGLSALLRGMDRSLPFAWQHLLVWGGLRGALCLALALGLPSGLPFRERIVSMTFGYVLFSLLVQGLTVDALIKRLGIAIRPLVPPDRPGREVDQPE